MSGARRGHDAAPLRVMVTGARGMLGSEVLRTAPADGVVRGVDVGDFDLRDGVACRRAVEAFRPAWILHCAARTDVDGCEADREGAFAVNAEGTRHLAEAARGVGAAILYVSTDFVFDGAKGRPYDEEDPVHPLSVYGASKLAGEVAVREASDRWAIVRTQWLYGPRGKNFVETILARARKTGRLRVVRDQVGSPTSTLALAPRLWRLAAAGARGVFHVTCRGETSWHGFARRIVQGAGMGHVTVEAVGTEAFPRPARRPAYSVLGSRRLEEVLGEGMPPWEDALDAYLRARVAEEAAS